MNTLYKVPAARNNEEWTCNTDCDCVPCSPYCNTYGWCQEDTGDGRRLIRTSECLQQRGSWQPSTTNCINVIISWLKPENNNNGLRNVWLDQRKCWWFEDDSHWVSRVLYRLKNLNNLKPVLFETLWNKFQVLYLAFRSTRVDWAMTYIFMLCVLQINSAIVSGCCSVNTREPEILSPLLQARTAKGKRLLLLEQSKIVAPLKI